VPGGGVVPGGGRVEVLEPEEQARSAIVANAVARRRTGMRAMVLPSGD
jgi:hypothetical protein